MKKLKNLFQKLFGLKSYKTNKHKGVEQLVALAPDALKAIARAYLEDNNTEYFKQIEKCTWDEIMEFSKYIQRLRCDSLALTPKRINGFEKRLYEACEVVQDASKRGYTFTNLSLTSLLGLEPVTVQHRLGTIALPNTNFEFDSTFNKKLLKTLTWIDNNNLEVLSMGCITPRIEYNRKLQEKYLPAMTWLRARVGKDTCVEDESGSLRMPWKEGNKLPHSTRELE